MSNRIQVIGLSLIIAIIAIGCDSTESNSDSETTTESIVGTWMGEVNQNGFKYDAIMSIEMASAGDSAGAITYQFVNSTCEGELIFNGGNRSNNTYNFTEENTTGGCNSPGIIKVIPQDDGTLAWAWYFPDENSSSAVGRLSQS